MIYEGRERTVVNVLRDQAARQADAPLLRSQQGERTRGDVDRMTNWLARRLAGHGVEAGDPVLLLLDNTERYVLSWIALAKLGAIEVPVNPAYRGQMLAHVVNASGASLLIADGDHLEALGRVIDECASLESILVADPGEPGCELPGLSVSQLGPIGSDEEAVAFEPSYDDAMALMFTSGTTGPSKGVLVAHAHAYEYANSVRGALELRDTDVYYAPLPLFHIAGQWAVVYAALMSGGTATIRDRFSVTEFWSDVRQAGATVSFLLGAMANFLFGQTPRDDDAANGLERMLMSPLIPELSEFRRRFGIEVATAYGSTECNVPILSDFAISDPRQCGSARSGWQVALVDESDEVLPPGSPGEIVVRPPEPWLTMKGYLGNPEATAVAYRNCWLHTGDIAYSDEDGNYYFVDRKSDAIRRRGENISSFEVEREVNAHPGVLECAVVGVSSEHTEEEVLAFVVPSDGGDGLDPSELHSFLTDHAPRFMVPRYIAVVDSLPKTDTGKIQKAALRELGAGAAWDATGVSA